jgi:hypothetical protein
MTTDCEGFHQGALFRGEIVRWMHLAGGENDFFGQAAIAHHPDGLMMLAAVGVPAAAGVALLAIDVGFHRAAIAHLDVVHAFTNFQDSHAELVSGNTRIGEEGHFAEVAAEVRPADADRINPDQGFTGTGSARLIDVDDVKVVGLG